MPGAGIHAGNADLRTCLPFDLTSITPCLGDLTAGARLTALACLLALAGGLALYLSNGCGPASHSGLAYPPS